MKATKIILGVLLLGAGAALIYFFWFAILGVFLGAMFFGLALLGVFLVAAFIAWVFESWVRTLLYVAHKLWELLKACVLWFLNLV